MNSRLYLSLAAAGALAVLGCSCTQQVAGGTSETTNGMALVQGTVLNADGTVAAGCRVLLIDQKHWLSNVLAGKSVVIDSALSAADGSFTFRTSVDSANIQIDADTAAVFARNVSILDSTVSKSFTLAPAASASGTVALDAGAASTLLLSGSAYAASPTGSAFTLDHVAAGDYTVVAAADTGGVSDWAAGSSILCAPGSAQAGISVAASEANVLLDDFFNPLVETSLGRIIGGGLWYTASDYEEGSGTSTVGASAISGAEAWSGNSLDIRFVLGTAQGTWAMTGCFFGPDEMGYDLSGLTTISFRAKGSGTMLMSLFSNVLDSVPGNTAHFAKTLTLSSDWTEIRIPVSSLYLDPASPAGLAGKTWADAARSVSAMRFMAWVPANNPGSTVNLLIDDMKLEGVSLSAFNH